MKICPQCGEKYADEALVCVVDQRLLVGMPWSAKTVKPAKVTCPQCGAADDFSYLPEAHSSFSLTAFLFGGLVAVFLRNAGRSRRVRCNRCQARFSISRILNKVSQVLFWFQVAPRVILLMVGVIIIIRSLFAH